MVTWLIQPVKIEMNKMEELMSLLNKAEIFFEIVYPNDGKVLKEDKTEFIFNETEKYFVCGSYPLTRNVFNKCPNAVFSLQEYNFEKLWEIFGKENFINDDAIITNSNNILWNEEELFIRPLEDTKSFNGGIYNKTTFEKTKYIGEIVTSKLKHIEREYRFFIIDGQVVTSSLYKVNGHLEESSIIDDGAVSFVKEMLPKFNHNGYVIDVATVNGEYKIMELNCLNASGFYKINLYKLILAVDDYYAKPEVELKSIKSKHNI
jgi:hypothetical protein